VVEAAGKSIEEILHSYLRAKRMLLLDNFEQVSDAAPLVADLLAEVPEQFILAADCTVPSDTPWEHLKTAIDAAHRYRN
jgi:uroporphyrinogen-III decarboxylase